MSEACDPDNLDRQQREADLLPLQAAVQEFMPHAAGPVTDFAACMFIMTPDGHFVIDTHPKHEQVSENRVGGVAVVGSTAAAAQQHAWHLVAGTACQVDFSYCYSSWHNYSSVWVV